MYQKFLMYGRKGVLAVEELADRIFTPQYNPFYYLGAIAIFFLWLLVVSGVYLFIFYEIGAPYNSIKYITEEQWYLGGIMRSVHRYAADGMIIATILHLIQVYFTDRYRHWRWIAWVSGIFLLAFIWLTGIIGYWMVWDERGQIIADLTAAFLDFFPIFGELLSLSFSRNNLITNLFFFVALFLHIMVPVLLFIFLWIHLIRVSHPVINPPRLIGIPIVGILLALSLLKPATSQLPADVGKIISKIGIDWFYLFSYPVFNSMPIWTSWIILCIGALILTFIPWYVKSKRPLAAEIIKENCTGCAQCFEDCPYEAIHMMPRTDGRPYDLEAIIISKRCASCGICVGSCSFNAVNFPEKTEKALLQEIKNSIATVKGSKEPVIVGIFCSYSVAIKKVVDPVTHAVRGFPHVGIITVPCIGMFNTSWIEYAFNSGVDGLFLCGCQINDCHYRFGNKWLEERLLGRRLPILRQTADRSLLRVFWHSELDVDKLLNEIAEFTEDIKNKRQKRFLPEEASMKKSQWALASIALSIPAALVFYLSDAEHIFSNPEDSLAKLSIKHSGKRLVECDDFALLAKEAEKYREALKETGMAQMELKQLGNCTRERHPIYMEVYIDNDRRLAKSYAPNGWKKDGASFIYEKFVLKPGIHNVLIKMRNTADGNRFDYTFEESIDFKKGYSTVIDFDENNKKFFLR